MSKTTVERVAASSPELVADQREALRHLFPEVFSEGQIDFAKLRATLGDLVDDRPERYSFTWAGKSDAIRALQAPSRATLVPARDESVNFDTTQHLFIEGDNLEVLKLLYKPYFGRVKMIYIDPPYNTGNDFVYSDDYTQPLDAYLRLTGQKDAEGNVLSSNTETGGRYHSNWLSMMYPRLFLARQLLREDGVIFVSIDDHEVHNLRLLMNEVFGEENFVTTVIWQKVYAPKNTARHFSEDHDYIIVYARNGELWKPSLLPRTEEANARYINPDNDPRGPWKPSDLTARNYYSKGEYEVTGPTGKKFTSGVGRYWRSSYESFLELDRDNRVWWGPDGSNMPAQKRFLSEVMAGHVPQTLWTYSAVGHTQEAKKELLEQVAFGHNDNVINTVKPTRLVQRMLQIATTPHSEDVVLDFFAGSASTAHAVLKQNRIDGGSRRFISVQLPERLPVPEDQLGTIADIGRMRLNSVITRFKHERDESTYDDTRETPEDLGFRVLKLAPSHWQPWEPPTPETDAEDYARALALFHDPLVGDWRAEDVIHEVMLREGFSLTSRIEPVEGLAGPPVWRVTDDDKEQSFYICLDPGLTLATTAALDLQKDDLFICRDIALDDTEAANLALQCRLKTI